LAEIYSFNVALPFAFVRLVLHQELVPATSHVAVVSIVISQVSPADGILNDAGLAVKVTSGITGSSFVELLLQKKEVPDIKINNSK
jgi:hypothetical protein